MNRETIFSPCRKYRYTLWREWWREAKPRPMCRDCADHDGICPNDGQPCDPAAYVQFIGLNPSTADETKDDPTIRRCIAFAKAWGYGALCMTNLFAWRETDSSKLLKVENPIGEGNQHHLLDIASKAGIVVAAWGTKGELLHMDLTVKQWLGGIGVKLHCLRRTKGGHPEHPLYLPQTLTPMLL